MDHVQELASASGNPVTGNCRYADTRTASGEEFWGRHTFPTFEAAATALPAWEHEYNQVRFSMALHGRTPAEKLAAVLGAAA